ncbi:MAG: serine--tRNA ligase [Patescibacteria group bacterium]
MIDIKFIREHADLVKEGMRKKGVSVDIDRLLELDSLHREYLREVEKLRAERAVLGEGVAKQQSLPQSPELPTLLQQSKAIKQKLKELEPKMHNAAEALESLLWLIPNLPKDDVKEGRDERDNEIIRVVGTPSKFSFEPRSSFGLGTALDLIDTERASKVSGTRFGYLKREAALLEFALVRFAMDMLAKKEFTPIIPPVLVGERAMRGMGYLDRGKDEIYFLPEDKLYLVGTSEQSVGPMHMDEIFEEHDLPRRYVAFSTCFRREAGSYGKDTRGILRVHQFDKVEMFSFTRPEDSDAEHEKILGIEEKLVQALKLPYQVVKMCSGDLGDQAARKYDIETWFPSEQRYRETHSASTCTDFQARRLNIRFRRKNGSLEYAHTLNGTAVTGRILIAIMENYQQKDGSIAIPKVLHPYTGFKKIAHASSSRRKNMG